MITALQLVCIDSRRMISKRKVCKLQAKTVLIALEHQFLTTLIPWFAIHDNARQNQPVEFLRRKNRIRANLNKAIITTHHHFMGRLAVANGKWSNGRDDKAHALSFTADDATLITGYSPYLAIHITHGTYLAPYLPLL